MITPIKFSLITDLLDIAEELAQRDERRPRQASLRRAVSTAYYALFHAICYVCADEFVGWDSAWNRVEPIYRLIDHGDLRTRLGNGSKSLEPDLARIGNIAVELQEQRASADYDPRPFKPRRFETLALIAQARRAVGLLETLSPEVRLRLATLLISKTRRR